MHIDIPRAQLLIEERDTMETIGKLLLRLFSMVNVTGTCRWTSFTHTYSPLHTGRKKSYKVICHIEKRKLIFFIPFESFCTLSNLSTVFKIIQDIRKMKLLKRATWRKRKWRVAVLWFSFWFPIWLWLGSWITGITYKENEILKLKYWYLKTCCANFYNFHVAYCIHLLIANGISTLWSVFNFCVSMQNSNLNCFTQQKTRFLMCLAHSWTAIKK